MKINEGFMELKRAGIKVYAALYRKQQEAGRIVAWCGAIAFFLIVVCVIWQIT